MGPPDASQHSARIRGRENSYRGQVCTIGNLLSVRTFPIMIDYSVPPEHTFLSSHEVFARYGWGRTKGYQTLDTANFPNAIFGRYRLDTLIKWEQQQLNDSPENSPSLAAAPGAPLSGDIASQPRPSLSSGDSVDLPVRRRTRRANTKPAV